MLTVNIKSSGSQRTIEAEEVCANSNNISGVFDEVIISKPDGRVEQYYQGEIFVMNDTGGTVAKYQLMPNQPIGCGDPEPRISRPT